MAGSNRKGSANAPRRNSVQYGSTSGSGTGTSPAGIPANRRFSHNIFGSSSNSNSASPGKINSLGHFASSYSRAQGFMTIEPPSEHVRARSYFVDEEDQIESSSGSQTLAGVTTAEASSGLLENQYRAGSNSSAAAAAAAAGNGGPRRPSFAARYASPAFHPRSPDNESAILDDDASGDMLDSETAPLLDAGDHTALLRNRRASYLAQPEAGTTVLREGEATTGGDMSSSVIVREVEGKDGTITTVVAGQSTAPQTIFNSVNVLVGMGLLSLSLGFKYSGWVIGLSTLVVSALATFFTADLLAKCMDTDHTLVTYADIAYAAYGPKARIFTSFIFTLEMLGAGVTMVVLFADSLNALVPEFSTLQYKILAFFLLTPLCFLPLRILSISSVLGILCTMGLVVIVFVDGLLKSTSPGSLLHPMHTWLWPQNWMAVPLSIGIFMAPWGGHAVFPNIYRDMRHPQKYVPCLVTTYQITFFVDSAMAILGFLMFGADISGEVSRSILLTEGYPPALGLALTTFIAIIPIVKTPLNVRPIVSTLDVLLDLDHVPLTLSPATLASLSPADLATRAFKVLLRVVVVLGFVLLSILFPSFDRIIGLLGCSMCTSICVLGPIAFYLKLYDGQIPKWKRVLCYVLFVFFSALAIVGTVWCFFSPETIENGFF